jgi:hypothetical protein
MPANVAPDTRVCMPAKLVFRGSACWPGRGARIGMPVRIGAHGSACIKVEKASVADPDLDP